MELEALLLSFYLLFPIISPEQQALADFAKKNKPNAEDAASVAKVLKELSLEEMYDEGQPILLSELEHPEYGPQSEGSSFVLGDGSVAEVLYRDSEERLSLFSYGEELLSLQDERSIVSVNGNTITRTKYDNFYRISERLVWSNATRSDGMKMLSRTRYSYTADSAQPASCVAEYFEGKKRTHTEFSANGKPTLIKEYDTSGEQPLLTKTLSFAYDSESRIILENVVFSLPSAEKSAPTQRTVYRYTAFSDAPDTDFYEDGVLRRRVAYSAQDVYTETIFFDANISVVTRYENGIKVLEEINEGR